MRTEKQIRASRENAKKSTGPRTPEGKARSSKNALKHGLLAQDSVIPGEDPAEFDRHLTTYEDTYLPRNCIEKELVRQIADAAWRMQRLTRIEATIITAAIERTRTYQQEVRRDRMREGHEGDLQLLGASMISGTQFLNDLGRYDAHLNRRFYRAVELMMKIRKEERKSREAQANAENLAAVRGNPSSRDRGVDGSPRSRSKTPIGFRPASPQNENPRNEAEPDLTPAGTTRYEATGAIGDAAVLRSAGLEETCGLHSMPHSGVKSRRGARILACRVATLGDVSFHSTPTVKPGSPSPSMSHTVATPRNHDQSASRYH